MQLSNNDSPTLYTTITNHGFGHATRTAAVLAAIQRQSQQLGKSINLIITTNAPRWLLESFIEGEFVYRQRSFDVGVIQKDSLHIDRDTTIAKIKHIQAHQAEIIAAEAEFLKTNHVDLVLADIPPLATAIAQAAEVPCWMLGNFGWDFIYHDWGGEFTAIADWIADLYGKCDRLFRLPFCEPMHSFPHVQDVGLVGGSPKYSPAELRQRFHWQSDRPTALLTFGGLSLSEIPYHNLAKFPDWQFITFDRNAPDLPNLTQICDHRLCPLDLMVVCDRVISKPGYSTIAEACRVGVPLICLTRDGFAEAEILIAGLQAYNKHLIISPDDFYQGNWQFLTAPLNAPHQSPKPDLQGEVIIAKAVLDQLFSFN